MAFTAGKNTVIKLDNGADSLIDISSYTDKISFSIEGEAIDTTAFGDTFKTSIGGLKNVSVSLSGSWERATFDPIGEAAIAVAKSMEYYPAGTTSGYPKYSVEVICTSYTIESAVDDKISWSADFVVSSVTTLRSTPA